MGDLSTWRHAGGGAPCLYCKEDIVAGIITWGQVTPVREQMSPP